MKGYLSPSLGKPEASLACLGPPLVALDRQGWLQMAGGKNGEIPVPAPPEE